MNDRFSKPSGCHTAATRLRTNGTKPDAAARRRARAQAPSPIVIACHPNPHSPSESQAQSLLSRGARQPEKPPAAATAAMSALSFAIFVGRLVRKNVRQAPLPRQGATRGGVPPAKMGSAFLFHCCFAFPFALSVFLFLFLVRLIPFSPGGCQGPTLPLPGAPGCSC